METVQDAFYLPVEGGRCFSVWRRPRDRAALRGCILHLPAFAEEMNKARRMTALAARKFAEQGYGVLQIDPIGCGDSSGDFGDATLTIWVENFLRAAEWIRGQCARNVWLWGLRAGALLVPPLLSRLGTDMRLLLWQPVVSGRQFLTQFLRLRLAAEMLDNNAAPRGNATALRERLKHGETLEIGGYRLSPEMADQLEGADFTLPSEGVKRVAWFEVTSSETPSLSPVARSRIDALRAVGIPVEDRALRGPGFWQSVEIEECPLLIDASVAAIMREKL